jgi:hypothetical protein
MAPKEAPDARQKRVPEEERIRRILGPRSIKINSDF